MSRPEHLPLPTTPREHSTGFWQHILLAHCHKRHEGKHEMCLLYHQQAMDTRMYDAFAFDLADAIHLRKYPRSGVSTTSRYTISVFQWMEYSAHNALLEINEMGGLTEDTVFEMRSAWIQFPNYEEEVAP